MLGATAQPAMVPTIARHTNPAKLHHTNRFMTLILLEALGALLILLLIVWWTMFSGRKNGELPTDEAQPSRDPKP